MAETESENLSRGAQRRRWPLFLGTLLLCSALIAAIFVAREVWRRASDSPLGRQEGLAPDRLERPLPPHDDYVGSAACVECHAEIARSYALHPMANSMERLTESTAKPQPRVSFSPTRRKRYTVESSETGVVHRELGLDARGETIYDQAVAIEYAVGSGRRGRSYAFRHEGYLLQSPISWYAKERRWDLSPGYPPEKHNRFERPLVERCLQCHAGRLNYAEDTSSTKAVRYAEEPFAELSIGCERCHGPAGRHIRHHREKRGASGDPIINPARLDAPRREAVCNQCHLQGVQQVLRYGRRHADFRPGEHLGQTWTVFVAGTGVAGQGSTTAVSQVEQMYSSTCYQRSRGALGCISCHDPHSFPAESEKSREFNARCQKCHKTRSCALPLDVQNQEPALGSCIACHMPPLRTLDVPHTVQTDHRVLRKPVEVPLREHSADDEALEVFDEFVCRLSPLELARAQGLAVAERAENQQHVGFAKQAEALLRPVVWAAPDDLDALDALALCQTLQGQRTDSLEIWRAALAIDPFRSEALHSLALHHERHGDFRSALIFQEKLVQVIPWRAEFHRQLSVLFDRVGEGDLAVAAAVQALELDPSNPTTYGWLADLYLRRNNIEASQQCRETLRRLVE